MFKIDASSREVLTVYLIISNFCRCNTGIGWGIKNSRLGVHDSYVISASGWCSCEGQGSSSNAVVSRWNLSDATDMYRCTIRGRSYWLGKGRGRCVATECGNLDIVYIKADKEVAHSLALTFGVFIFGFFDLSFPSVNT